MLLGSPLGMSCLVGQEPAPSKCVLFEYFQGGSEGHEGLGAVPGGMTGGRSNLMFGIWEGAFGYYLSGLVRYCSC